jgi:hypothetical protein
MAINNLVESKELRAQGVRLGRDGMSQRAHELIAEYMKNNPDGHYKDCIRLVGRLHAIYLATGCDAYWREKAMCGYERERYEIKLFNKNSTPDMADNERLERIDDRN